MRKKFKCGDRVYINQEAGLVGDVDGVVLNHTREGVWVAALYRQWPEVRGKDLTDAQMYRAYRNALCDAAVIRTLVAPERLRPRASTPSPSRFGGWMRAIAFRRQHA